VTVEGQRLLDPVGTVDNSAEFIAVENIFIIVIPDEDMLGMQRQNEEYECACKQNNSNHIISPNQQLNFILTEHHHLKEVGSAGD